jgi:hypothetical protein
MSVLHRASSIALTFGLLCTVSSAVHGAAVEAAKPKTVLSAELTQLDQEGAWRFSPRIGRVDTFYDGEQVLGIAKELAKKVAPTDEPEPGKTVDNNADLIAFALQEQTKIETLISARKYDETIRNADTALKRLERHTDVPEVRKAATRIGSYREQADDALTRNEAQSAFDSLGFKIEGILWSEAGQRLVILAGESRALGINDRVKDCVIINIDTDRVDFRFHHKRKRFEFPRYVGETTKSAANR